MNTSFYRKVGEYDLAVADLVQMSFGRMLITRINVPVKYRGEGIGSGLLKEICCEADKYRMELILEVMSSGDLSDEELVDWYSRHGFKIVSRENYSSTIMRRVPEFVYRATRPSKISIDYNADFFQLVTA